MPPCFAIGQIPNSSPFESPARAISGSIVAALCGGPAGRLSERAAKGGRILNENKRPDLAPVEQGVCVHEQIARPVAPRLNAVTRHITSTQQAMTRTQTLRGHGRQQCYGTTKTRAGTHGNRIALGRRGILAGGAAALAGIASRAPRGTRGAAGQADAGLAHQHRGALARSAAARRHRQPRQLPDGDARRPDQEFPRRALRPSGARRTLRVRRGREECNVLAAPGHQVP